MRSLSILLPALFILAACHKTFVPKPLGYNRLTLPPHRYVESPDTLPYRFAYSAAARLLDDTSALSERYWVQVNYPDIKATIHLTYKDLQGSKKLLQEYLADAYTLTAKHEIKAYAINESRIRTTEGKTAVVAEIVGEVPSQLQFTLTDSTQHFLRGALYFFTEVNNDSLAPAIDYMKVDMMHLINSVQWKTREGWQ